MKRGIAVVVLCGLGRLASADEAAPPAAAVAPIKQQGPRAKPQPDPLGEGFAAKPPTNPPARQKPRTPPAELTALGKQLAGTWTCKGNTARGDGSSSPLIATVTTKLDLDGMWIVTSLVERGGQLKWTQYTSYDPTARSWSRMQMANSGGHVISTSPGEQGGKWTWTGTATSPEGTLALRTYEQKDGAGWKLWGEAQISGAWSRLYEVSCKK